MDDVLDLRIQSVLDEDEESESSESSSGSSQEEDNTNQPYSSYHPENPNISYDTSLPGLHAYLGSDLNELSGRTVLDEESCQTIPIITLPGVVLVPGQTLPLQLFNSSTIAMMINIISNDRTFGLINTRFSGRVFTNVLETIGTTVEIRSYREEEGAYGGNILRMKAEGRQRFKVLESRTQSDGIIMAKVRILPELSVGDPGECSKLNSLNKFKHPPPNLNSKRNFSQENKCKQLVHRSPHKYNKYDFANYTWFPEFVYKMYDPEILMRRIKKVLHYWNRTDHDCMPSDPRDFSYWIAANLPLNDKQRLELLKINEVTERLRQELQIVQECSVLTCRDCMNIIAHRDDIFSMSLQGPQGTYVNPNGYVHEAITVYKAKKIRTVGRPSSEQSWFPGNVIVIWAGGLLQRTEISNPSNSGPSVDRQFKAHCRLKLPTRQIGRGRLHSTSDNNMVSSPHGFNKAKMVATSSTCYLVGHLNF